MDGIQWGGEPLSGLRLQHRGKVRDTYPLPEPELQLPYASNRVSIFDFVLNAEVEDKGAVLTAANIFWRRKFKDLCSHDLFSYGISMRPYLPPQIRGDRKVLRQAIVVRAAEMIPIEAVVRGYLTGSGWEAYKKTKPGEPHMVGGHVLPDGLWDGAQLPTPIFTPTTKAKVGHDEHLNVEEVRNRYGMEMEELSIVLYEWAQTYARSRGIIIADTKFEFGYINGKLALCDEVLTPDSSRFWKYDDWVEAQKEHRTPRPYDKQFVREWGKGLGINLRKPEQPEDYAWVRSQVVPQDVLQGTTRLYYEIFELLTGFSLSEFHALWMGIGL